MRYLLIKDTYCVPRHVGEEESRKTTLGHAKAKRKEGMNVNTKFLTVKRGEIFLVNFNKSCGSVQSGIRPALVVQNDIGNHYSSTVIVAAVTSRIDKKENQPTHYRMAPIHYGKNPSMVLAEQILTVDKSCLYKYIGRVKKMK